MAALIASRFPEKAPELFAYQASIARAERNFDDRRWVSYDRCYRREALAPKNLDWSVPNARLYNEAFTGHARAVPRCSFCLQEDHLAQYCPRNPNRPWFVWLGDTSLQPSQSPNHQGSGRGAQSAECCRRFNDGRCKQSPSMCRYAHRCADCGGPHPRLHCTRGGHQGGSARPRSPLARPQQQGPAGASTWSPSTRTAPLSRPPPKPAVGSFVVASPIRTETCVAQDPAGTYNRIYIYNKSQASASSLSFMYPLIYPCPFPWIYVVITMVPRSR